MADAKFRDRGATEEAKNTAETIARASGDVIRETSERVSEPAREGIPRASAASKAGTEAMVRTGSSVAEGMQDITKAWANYAEAVMRQTSQASRALIGCRTLSEMFEIQTQLVRSNLEAFLDQSSKIAEIAGRMATRPLEALRQTTEARPEG